MPILLKLFGDLRKKAKPDIEGSMSLRLNIDHSEVERVIDIMRKFNIEEDEVYHIFINGTYSGYSKKVKEGDIVALFPKNMSVLYKWYFPKEEDE